MGRANLLGHRLGYNTVAVDRLCNSMVTASPTPADVLDLHFTVAQ